MKVIPWILVLVLAGSSFFLFSKGQEKEKEMTALRQQIEALEGKVAELEQIPAGPIDPEEFARLQKVADEVFKLRGEVTQLRRENQHLKNRPQTVAAAPQEIPFDDDFPPAEPLTPEQQAQVKLQREHAEACVTNLKALEDAKSKWATTNNKSGGEPATQNDVLPFVPNQTMPLCPSGGTYTFNEVGIPASCSVEGHSLLP